MRDDACGMFRSAVVTRLIFVSFYFVADAPSLGNRGVGRCIKAQRVNHDGSPAAPYQPQENCHVTAFERAIGLQGAELPLSFDADDAAVSCGGMFFPMQAPRPVLLRHFCSDAALSCLSLSH